MTPRSLCSLAVAVLGLLLWPGVAVAERGVAVDIGRIDVDEALRPGNDHALPGIGVRNPGTVATSYEVTVMPVESDREPVPEAWLSFSPDRFDLDPEDRQQIEPVLELPEDAPAGDYETLLAARIGGDQEGAGVASAAAARLTFTVDRSAPPDGPGADPVRTGWLVAGLIAVALLAWGARSLKGVRVRIERPR